MVCAEEFHAVVISGKNPGGDTSYGARYPHPNQLNQKKAVIPAALLAAPGKLLSPRAFMTVFKRFWC